jgi:hypothetical protein
MLFSYFYIPIIVDANNSRTSFKYDQYASGLEKSEQGTIASGM